MSFTILDLPAGIKPRTTTWRPVDLDARAESPVSGYVQYQVRPGVRWQTDLSFGVLDPAKRQKMDAVLTLMAQRTYLLRVEDYTYVRQGSGAGSPKVDGASQSGLTLNTKGWTPSATGVLLAGDRIQLDTYQVIIVPQDVDADINGDAAIPLGLPLRESPTDDTAIETATPKALFEIPALWAWQNSRPQFAGTTIALLEKLNPDLA